MATGSKGKRRAAATVHNEFARPHHVCTGILRRDVTLRRFVVPAPGPDAALAWARSVRTATCTDVQIRCGSSGRCQDRGSLQVTAARHHYNILALLKRTVRDLWTNDVLGLAAQTAYYCFYSLFPILLFCASILSLVGNREQTFVVLMNALAQAAPADAMDLIEHVLHDVVFVGNATSLISVGAVLTVWTGSNVFASLADALNRAAAVRERRPFWKVFLLSMAFVIGAGITSLLATGVLVFGKVILDAIGSVAHLQTAARLLWLIAPSILVIAMVLAMGATIFRFLPSERLAWHEAFVGSTVATLMWMVVTVGFRVYVEHFNKYNQTYGAIGAVIVLLTWIYLSMLSAIAGGQLAAELHWERVQMGALPSPGTPERVAQG